MINIPVLQRREQRLREINEELVQGLTKEKLWSHLTSAARGK